MNFPQKPYNTNRRAVRRFLLETQSLLDQGEQRKTKKGSRSSNILDKSFTNLELDSVMQMIRQLECVQLDPVAAVERNQHLVLAARIPGYQPEMLNQLLKQGHLFEYWANAACTIPMEDYPVFQPTRKRMQDHVKVELEKYESVVNEVLERLKAEGPLPARAFRSSERVHGYWDNKLPKTKATSHVLNLLLDASIIRVVQREGSERFFNLTGSTVPEKLQKEAQDIDMETAVEALVEKYIRAYRVFDISDSRFGWKKLTAQERRDVITRRIGNGTVIPLEIEGIRRPYFILSSDLELLKEHERDVQEDHFSSDESIRFLPPLDNLLWRRERLVDLFDFHYKWEIYTPQEKRVYGYYAMPILAGDQLIGRIDPRLDRENGSLHIRLLQLEPGVKVTVKLRKRIHKAIESFAAFHGAKTYTIEEERSF